MTIPNLLQAAWDDKWEVGGNVSGLVCVWLTARKHIACWPAGIVNAVFFLIMFVYAKLYADVGLQAVYVVLSAYGWYHWLHPEQGRTELPVSRFPVRGWIAAAGIWIAGTAALGAITGWLGSAYPLADSALAVACLIAQWMLTRKILENWAIWITADVGYVVMYAMKGLRLTSALYALFIVICISGWREWRASWLSGTPLPA